MIKIKRRQLKPNNIYHGDCLNLMKYIPDNSIDMIFTDPPYGHNNNNNDMIANREAIFSGKNKVKKVDKSEYRPILNDGNEANEIFKNSLIEFKRILKPGACCCCCCGGGGPDPQFARWILWLSDILEFKMMVVWDKGPMGMGFHYRRSYETVLIAQKIGRKTKWYDKSKKIENIIRPGDYKIKKIIPSKKQHPTQKPINLSKHFILLHSKINDIIFDPFCGYATTLQAAKLTGRKYIGIELDRKFYKIAKERIKKTQLPIEKQKWF